MVDYQDVKDNYLGQPGWTYAWDDATKDPTLYNAGLGQFITYDDARSIAAKVQFAKDEGMLGVMVWGSTPITTATFCRSCSFDLADTQPVRGTRRRWRHLDSASSNAVARPATATAAYRSRDVASRATGRSGRRRGR